MCFANNSSKAGVPVVASVPRAPTTASVTAAGTTDTASSIAKNAALVAKRQGVFGNIKTTPLGDASYGSFATFGSRTKRAA